MRSIFHSRKSLSLSQNNGSTFNYRSSLQRDGIAMFPDLVGPPRLCTSNTVSSIFSSRNASLSLNNQYHHDVKFGAPQRQPVANSIFVSQTAVSGITTISNLENFGSGTVISCHQKNRVIGTNYQSRKFSFLQGQKLECNTQYSNCSSNVITANAGLFYKSTKVLCEVTSTSTKIEISNYTGKEVVNTTKSLFGAQTSTLCHGMFCNTSRPNVKGTVLSPWDTASDAEKRFHKPQVLGSLSFESLNVNPQLDGTKSSINDLKSKSSFESSFTGAEGEVQNLFDSRDDANNRISHPQLKRKPEEENGGGSKRLCYRTTSDVSVDPIEVDEETDILRMSEDNLNNEFSDDMEINTGTELEECSSISDNGIRRTDNEETRKLTQYIEGDLVILMNALHIV